MSIDLMITPVTPQALIATPIDDQAELLIGVLRGRVSARVIDQPVTESSQATSVGEHGLLFRFVEDLVVQPVVVVGGHLWR